MGINTTSPSSPRLPHGEKGTFLSSETDALLGSIVARAIAAAGPYDAPQTPDAALLDLLSEGVQLTRQYNEVYSERGKGLDNPELGADGNWTPAFIARDSHLLSQQIALERRLTQIVRRARRFSAATPAAIFAKALIVRGSKTGAAELAKSLAEDLLRSHGLRAAIWPVETVQ